MHSSMRPRRKCARMASACNRTTAEALCHATSLRETQLSTVYFCSNCMQALTCGKLSVHRNSRAPLVATRQAAD